MHKRKRRKKQMRNTLADLNNILFEQMERLQDDELKGENLETELKKTKSIVDVASTVIENATLSLEAQKFLIDMGISTKVNIPMLGISDKNEI
jgi:conserved domain protein